MVSADKDLEAVISGARGLLTGDAKPEIIVDSSTVSLEASARVRARAEADGVQFLAAPVSGNPKVIAAGKLTVAASGPRAAFDAAEPLLATWGAASPTSARARAPGWSRSRTTSSSASSSSPSPRSPCSPSAAG